MYSANPVLVLNINNGTWLTVAIILEARLITYTVLGQIAHYS
jgi:hypothetical protein